MRLQIRNRGTAALSALTLVAATSVALVGMQSGAQAADSSNTNAYQCQTIITAGTFTASTQPDYAVALNGPDTIQPGDDIVLTGAYTPALNNGPVALADYTASNRISVTYTVNAGSPVTVDGAFGTVTAPVAVPSGQPVPNPTPGSITIPGASLAAGDVIEILPLAFRQNLTSSSLGGQTGYTDCQLDDPAGDGPTSALSVTVETPAGPELTLTKSAVQTSFEAAGDVLDYEFEVENTGAVDVTAVTITDALLDAAAVCAPATVDIGATTTCTGSHTVTAGEVTAGEVVNTATATGDAEGDDVTSNESTATVAIAVPELGLEKAAGSPTFTGEGDVIDYTFTLTNTGNTTIDGPFTVTDDLTADEACPAAPASLAPDEFVECSATYTATAGDVEAGEVVNTATASAANGGNAVDSAEDSVTITLAEPAVSLTKNANRTTFTKAGDVIGYTLTLTNSGNVDLEAPFAVDDPLTEDEACPATPTTLAPDASIECTASYTVTADDVTAEEVINTATGSATYEGDEVVSEESSVTVPFESSGPTQDIPSRVTETFTDINCSGALINPAAGWSAGNVAGGVTGKNPTITLDLSPAVPTAGQGVTVSVTFDQGIANGPSPGDGGVRPIARVFLTGGVEDTLLIPGTPYGTPANPLPAYERLPGQTMTLENAFEFPASGEPVIAELDTITFDSNRLTSNGQFNWPNEPASSWSQFTIICNKSSDPFRAGDVSIGLQAAVPYEGELPPDPTVDPPADSNTDTTDTAGGTLPQTGGSSTVPALITALVLFQLGLILAVRSVRLRPARGSHAAA